MAVNKTSDLQIGDMVTHTGKRGFWDVDKSHKGIGFVLSPLYKCTIENTCMTYGLQQ